MLTNINFYFRCFAIIIVLVTAKNVVAQDPIHFLIGEDQLAGVEVYNITQTKDQTYWIASNNGVIKYDGYAFTSIPSIGLLGNSVFDFKETSNGLFCKNLSGQIIEVKNDTARVFFQIPDSLMSTEFDYFFDNDGQLHILSAGFYKVDRNRIEIIIPSKAEKGAYTSLLKIDEHTVVFQKPSFNQLYQYLDGKLLKKRIDVSMDVKDCFLGRVGSKSFLLNKKNGELGIQLIVITI